MNQQPPPPGHGYPQPGYPQQQQQQQYPQNGYPQAQPPPPKKSRAKLVIYGVLGLLIVGSCGSAMLAASTPEAKAKREAAAAAHSAKQAEAAAVASQAAAVASAEAQKYDDDWRKACRLKPDATFLPLSDAAIKGRCRALVEESLKVPGSEDWPSQEPDLVTYDKGCTKVWEAHVVAKNAFGVPVKTSFACTFDPRNLGFKLKM